MLMDDEKLKRIEELKHHEQLLFKTLSFLSSYLVNNNVGYYEELEQYKKMGFNNEDLDFFGLRDYELEKEISFFQNGRLEEIEENGKQ